MYVCRIHLDAFSDRMDAIIYLFSFFYFALIDLVFFFLYVEPVVGWTTLMSREVEKEEKRNREKIDDSNRPNLGIFRHVDR